MVTGLERASRDLVELSRWVDRGNLDRDPEAVLMLRAIKLSEEVGEVTEALIGWMGANPRKGRTHGVDDVLGELLDVAVTALGVFEHIDGHRGRALDELMAKITTVDRRAAESTAARSSVDGA